MATFGFQIVPERNLHSLLHSCKQLEFAENVGRGESRPCVDLQVIYIYALEIVKSGRSISWRMQIFMIQNLLSIQNAAPISLTCALFVANCANLKMKGQLF